MSSLRNVEEDDAGRLKSFRKKYGRGWDVEASEEDVASRVKAEKEGDDSLMDLISGYSVPEDPAMRPEKGSAKPKK
jgi:hypothetical protein